MTSPLSQGLCLMKQEMYNWREIPLPIEDRQGSHGFPQVHIVICVSSKDFVLDSKRKEMLGQFVVNSVGLVTQLNPSTRDIRVNVKIMKRSPGTSQRGPSELGWILQ